MLAWFRRAIAGAWRGGWDPIVYDQHSLVADPLVHPPVLAYWRDYASVILPGMAALAPDLNAPDPGHLHLEFLCSGGTVWVVSPPPPPPDTDTILQALGCVKKGESRVRAVSLVITPDWHMRRWRLRVLRLGSRLLNPPFRPLFQS